MKISLPLALALASWAGTTTAYTNDDYTFYTRGIGDFNHCTNVILTRRDSLQELYRREALFALLSDRSSPFQRRLALRRRSPKINWGAIGKTALKVADKVSDVATVAEIGMAATGVLAPEAAIAAGVQAGVKAVGKVAVKEIGKKIAQKAATKGAEKLAVNGVEKVAVKGAEKAAVKGAGKAGTKATEGGAKGIVNKIGNTVKGVVKDEAKSQASQAVQNAANNAVSKVKDKLSGNGQKSSTTGGNGAIANPSAIKGPSKNTLPATSNSKSAGANNRAAGAISRSTTANSKSTGKVQANTNSRSAAANRKSTTPSTKSSMPAKASIPKASTPNPAKKAAASSSSSGKRKGKRNISELDLDSDLDLDVLFVRYAEADMENYVHFMADNGLLSARDAFADPELLWNYEEDELLL